MSSPVLIVSLPTNPIRFEALRPNANAADLLLHLEAQEMEAQIVDFATVESYERLVGPGSPVWTARRSNRRRNPTTGQPAALNLRSAQELEYVADWTYSRLDRYRCRFAAQRIVYIVGDDFGEDLAAVLTEKFAVDGMDPIDAALMRVPGAGSGFIAQEQFAVGTKSGWRNLNTVPEPERVWPSLRRFKRPLSRAAGFSPSRYTALEDETKLLIFDIGQNASPQTDEFGLLRAIEECSSLYREHRSRAFQFNRSIAGDLIERLAHELIARRLGFVYCVHGNMKPFGSAFSRALPASGCVSARIGVPTGSQRLLEDVYEAGYGISAAVDMLRSVALSGVHTGVSVTYPIPVDDHHTADETVRFLRRAAPHAVYIDLPENLDPEPSARKRRSMQRERDALRSIIAELGLDSTVTPWEAMVAALARYSGRERQFLSHVDYLLCSGDIVALGEVVESINRNASKGMAARYWPLDDHGERVVGN